ncbi:MAG: Rieske (2Fe-2S) protein [Nitrososphaerota archaeon]|nr:Rieske (2Fe-2S) protein [Nitrososphaerota archaeon]
MAKKVFVCKLSDLPDSEPVRIDLEDRELLVLKTGRVVYVTDVWCTHQRSDLTLGIIDLNELSLRCALHQARFRISDGAVLEGPQGSSPDSIPRLKTYDLVIEDDSLYLKL